MVTIEGEVMRVCVYVIREVFEMELYVLCEVDICVMYL